MPAVVVIRALAASVACGVLAALLAAPLALAAPAAAAAHTPPAAALEEAIPPPPGAAACRRARASRSLAPIVTLDPRPGAPRVFALQFRQEMRHVVSYASFRTKIECLLRTWVVPRKARGRPNVVALTEDIGLATLATGSRGAADVPSR